MTLESDFITIPLERAHDLAIEKKNEGARFVQIHAVNGDGACDLYYTFMENGVLKNYKVESIAPNIPVESITDVFLAAFVFENEARELFGIGMRNVAIDFGGHMYDLAETAPMTFVSPEQKAAREKARKAAEGLAEKSSTSKSAAESGNESDKDAALEAKLANMDPEKAAKVRAAMAAKAARASKDNKEGEN